MEVRSAAQIKEALEAGVDRIMLDNMSPARVRRLVKLVGGAAQTESSGNINLKTVRAYAGTGVDFISVGALTHSPPSVDVSLLIDV